jgi:TonB-linked SusC/RagA family outer membrane protein
MPIGLKEEVTPSTLISKTSAILKTNKSMNIFSYKQSLSIPKHTYRIMKLTVVALVVGVSSLFASETYSQTTKITLAVEQMSIQEVLLNIEKQTDFLFVYDKEKINVDREVSLVSTNKPTSEILNQLFEGTGVTYKMVGKNITLIKKQSSNMSLVSTQQVGNSITGTVMDVNGETVIGANVIEKGTTNGTVTDFDGNFSLEITKNATIVISYIGYVEQEIKVTGKSAIKITLRENAQDLDEVVVVGYGVQKKVNLTGSVSAVKGEDISLRPVTNATQSLQGLVPGLTVSNNNSGRPGSSGTLSLRGQGNLENNANPYVLVDGVEMSLSDVNPNDIENISVLKDAAASAIYGARAAYGVILVTTKKGVEGKMRVSYQGTVGWSSPTSLPEMANAYDFATYFNEACKNAGVNQQYSPEKLAQLKQYVNNPEGIDPWSELTGDNMVAAFENTAKGVGNVDYFKLHYKDAAFKQNHNVSLSGGTKQAQYYVSTGLYSEEGIMRFADMDYKRYNFSGNLTSQMTDWLKLKVNTKFMHSDENTPFGDGGLSEGFYHSMARFRPTVNEIDPNGNYTELTMIPYLQSGTYTQNKKYNMSLTGGFEIQPLKNWFIIMDYTYRMNSRQYEALNVAPMIPGADGKTLYKGTRSELGVSPNGKFTRIEAANNYQNINLYTNYLFSINDNHNFTLMGGYQEDSYDHRYLKNTATDLISTTTPGLSLGTGDQTIVDTREGWATRGFFGRINYDYQGKYLVEANARYDGSSRFASESRWGIFPSVSLGWNIMRESFMEPFTDVLSILKLRASYGLLGNQNGAAMYTFASLMETEALGDYYFTDGRQMYIKGPGVVVPNTTWEKVESQNIGLDFGLLNNSLTGTIDLFQRDTKDMLGPTADLADMFGAKSPNTNNACMRNKGWELSIQYKGSINKDITYTVGGLLSDATSEVTSYENPTGTDPTKNWYTGKEVGEIWGYRASGLIQDQAEADAYNKAYDLSYLTGQKWTPGDVKYLDLNGDNKINNGTNTLGDMGDQEIIGNTMPRYHYTLNGSIAWKGLSLSMIFQGIGKRDWAPGSGSVYFWGSGPYAQVTVFDQHLDYWTEDNKGAYYPKPYTAGGGAINQFRNKTSQVSDRYVQSAAYCRLKNMTISYVLPETWTKKVGLSKTQIFFSVENLFTFTKLPKQFDPETIYTKNTYTSESGKNYPMNRVISFGLIVNL